MGESSIGEVGLLFGEAVAGVFGDARAFADGGGGVAAGGVDGGRADDESHGNVRCFLFGAGLRETGNAVWTHPTIESVRTE